MFTVLWLVFRGYDELQKRKRKNEKKPLTGAVSLGVGIAQWLEHQPRDWKVTGSNPCLSGGKIFFSRVNFLCWLLFWYPFHPRVTAVALKRPLSFCQKCRWQVTAKHAYTLHMALHEVTWCMVVWCTQNAPRWQQFHVAPAMPAL